MEEVIIPWEYGMEVMGHRDAISCGKPIIEPFFYDSLLWLFFFGLDTFGIVFQFVVLIFLFFYIHQYNQIDKKFKKPNSITWY